MLVVEVGADVAGGSGRWIRVWLSLQALSQILVVALRALAHPVDPFRVRLRIAEVAESLNFDARANAGHAFERVA